MTCLGSSGTGIPQEKLVREIERSLKSAFDEADDLVAAAARRDEIGIGIVEGQQPVLPGR